VSTASIHDIKIWYNAAPEGISHMIVAWDSFSGDNYPIYVPEGENPEDHRPKNGDSVDECYRMSLGWESQAKEHRARHWEFEAKP
jgi:hypothetical protein